MPTHYDFSQLTIMVVDDNRFMQRVIRSILASMGVKHVHTMNDAGEALTALSEWHPDVVITDWEMGAMSGGELARAIRALEGPVRFVPIFALTAHADADLVGRARDAGVDYTLAKPVSIDRMYKGFVYLRSAKREFVQVTTYFGPDRRRKSRPFEFQDRRGGRGRANKPKPAPEMPNEG